MKKTISGSSKKSEKNSVKKVAKKKSIKPKPAYSVLLRIHNKTYRSSGDDLQAVILALKPAQVKDKALFTLKHNGLESKVPIYKSFSVRRIISNSHNAFHFGRRLTLLLK